MLCTLVCYVSVADFYVLLKQQLIKVQVKTILNLCAPTCSSSRLDLDFSEDFHDHGFTAASLSGLSKLAKFEIFQASNSLFFLLVDFLDQKLSITHSHQLGLLSGSGFITWQTGIGGYDFVEIFALGSVLSLFRALHTRLSMFMKTTVTKIVQPKVSEHILFQFVQHSYRQ